MPSHRTDRRLCFILPAEDVDPSELRSPRKAKQQRRRLIRRRQLLAGIRRLLSRCRSLEWRSIFRHCGEAAAAGDEKKEKRRQQQIIVYYDAAGAELLDKVGAQNPRIFSFAELYIGSNGFCDEEILGSGGFGKVYRAILPSDGTVVAVKCLAERGEQFEKTFAAELVAVAHLRHRNLVRLRGWCVHEGQLLLVYDYMPNRSLDRLLFKKPEKAGEGGLGGSGSSSLSWERRRRIVGGLAAALYYLHEQLETQIIHRDVKASNVMLDSNYNARLGDFGLARWLEHELEYHPQMAAPTMSNREFRLAETTRIGGTIGYLPPESFQKRSAGTAKSDVFSFGVVLLEVVSGRRAVDLTFSGEDEIVLVDYARRLSDERRLLELGDGKLPDGSYSLAEMERLIHLGLLCTLHDPQSRPNMKWVVEKLSAGSGELAALPSFRSQPRYISLSSQTNTNTTATSRTGTGTGTTTTTTTTNGSSNTTTITVVSSSSISSNYFTAAGETIYATAEFKNTETEGGGGASSSSDSGRHRCPANFPVLETPREISYKEIIAATNNFSEDNRQAEVDFGTAYYGVLHSRHHVLVKRLGMKTCPALRARFSNELQNLGHLRHRNLVQLRGWCTEQGEMLVVYDYSAARLLSHLLFHHKHRIGHSVLQWHQRYNIVRSLASAILYLHEEWDEQLIHKNITSSAVILDPDMNPRLGSFALSEFLIRNEHGPHVVRNSRDKSVRGIFGYMSPEYMESGEAASEADTYSFGVVVLEVVTGQMAVDFRHPHVLLVKRVREFLRRQRPVAELADWSLDGQYNNKELVRLVKVGMACTCSSPERRPTMRKIVSILDGNDECLMQQEGQWKEPAKDWGQTNELSLSLVRSVQALGIH